jgi:hypothetical protein
MKHAEESPEHTLPILTEDHIDILIEALARDPERLAEVVSRAGPEDVRGDGWTPFARRLFLSVLADTGRVTTACHWSQMSKQSAYALRARDRLFAAGWDAACEIARGQLADALYEKAIDGVTETIVRDGEVVAERHRFDARLSIAVLHRLDKRCDRAEEQGSPHLPAVANWDRYLTHIGRGEEEAAAALLQSAPHGQAGQLPLGENPIEAELSPSPEEAGDPDLSGRCWQDDDGHWMTNFPPPDGFDGYEKGTWRDLKYERDCSPGEAALLDANEQAANEEDEAGDAELRDRWFACLAGEQDESPGAEPASPAPAAVPLDDGASQRPRPVGS